jgi:hypothetical protein
MYAMNKNKREGEMEILFDLYGQIDLRLFG